MRSKNSPACGIRVRHGRSCASAAGGNCNCRRSYEASVWSRRDRRKLRQTFPTLAAAKTWMRDAETAVRRNELWATSRVSVREAADAWLDGADAGTIRTRSGDVYKPSVLRSYASSLRLHVLPALGGVRLSELRRRDVQDLADQLLAKGLDPSTIRNALMPLRVLCRRAIQRQEITVNPCVGLELPAVRGTRDRVASPEEAAALIAALPSLADRTLWATAFYAGLRCGELRALRWADVDLDAGVIRVEASWDRVAGPVAPKSRSGRRVVPIAAALRAHLVEHRLACAWSEGLVFGRSAELPFDPSRIADRAYRAWDAAELPRFSLHEARHTCASLMIAAGVNLKALASYLGHASITITLDRYGHLMPGSEGEAAALLDGYLDAAKPQVRP
jgi:integrase